MKQSSSLWELIFTVVFMMAGTTMLIAIVKLCNSTEFHYISDKTVYDVREQQEVNSLISLDYGGALLLPAIQDDYTPVNGRNVEYYYTGNFYNPYNTCHSNPAAFGFNVGNGWKGQGIQKFSEGIQIICTEANLQKYSEDGVHLVWHDSTDYWTVTTNNVNIYNMDEYYDGLRKDYGIEGVKYK